MKFAITAIVVALVATSAMASSYLWNGSVSNVWSVAGNWTPLDGGTAFPQGAGNTGVFLGDASVNTTGLAALPSLNLTGTLSLTIPSGTLQSPNNTTVDGTGGLKILAGKIKFLQGSAGNTFGGGLEIAGGTAKAMISGGDKIIPASGLKMTSGVLQFMADNAVVDTAPVNFSGGEVNFSTTTETLGVVTVGGNGIISDYNFGGGDESHTYFANSSGATWTPGAVLGIEYLASGGYGNIYFGTDATGLTADQLAQIQFKPMDDNWDFTGEAFPAALAADGKLVIAPEPMTLSLMLVGGIASLIRRRR